MRRAHRRAHLLLWVAVATATVGLVLAGPRLAVAPDNAPGAAPDAVFAETP